MSDNDNARSSIGNCVDNGGNNVVVDRQFQLSRSGENATDTTGNHVANTQLPPNLDSNSSHSSASSSSSPTVFYVLFISPDVDQFSECNSSNASSVSSQVPSDFQFLYTDKEEILKAIKKFRGARFKTFKTHDEALEFLKQPVKYCGFRQSITSTPTTTDSPNLERGTIFRGPRAQELVKLRKAIESGDAEFFGQTVWANPRYLISSGDTPTILQEGPRYNALHVAAKAKQATMGKIILDTIEDVKFMALLYNDDSESTRLQRINFLVDLYLNMPDKGLCETPLHFASKFGCVKIVEMLASHPACDKQVQNKYNQTAKDVICTRSSSSGSETRRQIEDALEDHYFVPVLAVDDSSQPPYVGDPWSPRKMPSQLPPLPSSSHMKSPLASSPFVRAYAGPMSPRQADEFHHKWKNPPYSKCSTPSWSGRARLMGIRLSDTDKGLERIGRDLAKDLRISWLEHWSFLGTYCDLSKPDGLNRLETYLRNKYNEMSSNVKYEASQCLSILDGSAMEYADDSSVFEDEKISSQASSSCGSLCSMFGKLRVISSPESLGVTTPPMFSSNAKLKTKNHLTIDRESSQQQSNRHSMVLDHVCRDIATKMTYEICERTAQCSSYGNGPQNFRREFIEVIKPGIECLLRVARQGSPFRSTSDSVERSSSDALHDAHSKIATNIVQNLREEYLDYNIVDLERMSARGAASYALSSDDESEEDLNHYRGYAAAKISTTKATIRQQLRCILKLVIAVAKDEPIDQDCYGETSNDVASGATSSKAKKQDRIIEKSDRRDSDDVLSDDSASADTYYTPPSSIISSHSSSLSEARTPDEGLLVFINGAEPTKLDLDVLRALEGVHIDPILYPNTCRWRHLVTSYTREETERWPTPSSQFGRGPQTRRSAVSSSRLSTDSWSPSVHLDRRRNGDDDNDDSVDLRSVQTNLYDSFFKGLVNE